MLLTRVARGLPLTLALLGGATLTGCGGGGADSPSEAEATVVVDGSSTVFRISKAAQEAYSTSHPEASVVVDKSGTGGGFGRYLMGEVDIVDASRNAKPDEESKAKAQGIEWSRYLVGYDGITVVVNARNDFCKSLTVEQLKKLWSPENYAKTWKDLDPSWPDRKVVLYSPDPDSGTFEFFTEAIIGKAKSQRRDVQPSSDDNILVNGVAGDPDGLGYFGYAYFAANADKLKAVAIQNGPEGKPVLPTSETVLDKSYAPLSRPLYLFVKNSAARRGSVAGFLKFYLDDIENLAKKAGYVAPTAADREANAKTLGLQSGAAAGTPKTASAS